MANQPSKNLEALNTERLSGVSRVAKQFPGSDGRAKIQNAIDDLPSTGGSVIVGPIGPDTNNEWRRDASITLPSNVTVLLVGATIKQKPVGDGENTTAFRNADETNGDENISLIGIGNAAIDENGTNTGTRSESEESLAVRFFRVDGLEVRGLTITDTHSWALRPEASDDVHISDITFEQTNSHSNQDGLDLVGPTSAVTVSDLRGTTGDDFIAIADNYPDVFTHGSGGVVEDVTLTNITGEKVDTSTTENSLIRFASTNGFDVKDITVSNVSARGFAQWFNFGAGGTGSTVSQDDVRNITISNVTGSGNSYLLAPGQKGQDLVINGGSLGVNSEIARLSGTWDGIHLHNLDVTGPGSGSGTNGITFRGTTTNVTIRSCTFSDMGHGIDTTNGTVTGLEISNTRWENMGGEDPYRFVDEPFFVDENEQLPNVATGGSQPFNGGNAVQRFVSIRDKTNNHTAAFLLAGGSVTEVADPDGSYGTTSGSGNLHDVVWDGTNNEHQVENASGGEVDYELSYGGFPAA